jgi:cyclophilin family peptidyl-prolyl cis-trans isomerase
MTLAALSSSSRRLATVGLVAWLVAACGVPTAEPTPSPTPMPTLPPTAPAYTLGPAPVDCPTAAPPALAAGTTATVTFETNYGQIVIKVDGTSAPNGAAAFLALARCGYYNNVLFHRVIAGFMVQAGDGQYARLPNYDTPKFGTGGPGWTIPDDKAPAKYARGMVALANTGAGNSASSQFFIILADSADQALSGANEPYAQFGTVTSGMDVVDKIALVPVGGELESDGVTVSRPLVPVVITATKVTMP